MFHVHYDCVLCDRRPECCCCAPTIALGVNVRNAIRVATARSTPGNPPCVPINLQSGLCVCVCVYAFDFVFPAFPFVRSFVVSVVTTVVTAVVADFHCSYTCRHSSPSHALYLSLSRPFSRINTYILCRCHNKNDLQKALNFKYEKRCGLENERTDWNGTASKWKKG